MAQVRELWYRASLAWQEALGSGGSGSSGGKRRKQQQAQPEGAILVVAHNAGKRRAFCLLPLPFCCRMAD